MKRLTALLLLLALIPAGGALAGRKHDGPSITIHSCCEPPTRWADRWDAGDVDTAIETEDRGVTLLLADRVVALQLSDRSMKKIRKEMAEEREDEEDNALARAVKSAVMSGVRSMLDHSIECRVRDLRSVEYRGGRLVLTTNDGERIFEKIEVDDRDVLASFDEADARQFVAAFRRAKHGR